MQLVGGQHWQLQHKYQHPYLHMQQQQHPLFAPVGLLPSLALRCGRQQPHNAHPSAQQQHASSSGTCSMQQWSASQQPQAAPQQLPIGCSRLAYVNALPGVFAAAQRATSSSHSASSSSSSSGGGPSGGRKPQDESDFGANFGEAVVLLREDLPLLFERDPRWHIYRDDITFATPSMRYTTGLWKYKLLHKAARWLGNLLYADCSVSLTRMWQTAGNRRQLRVRWCVSGRPRLSLSVDDRPEKTEVISTYTFDASGKIFQHRLDRLIPPESRLFRALESLIELLQPGMLPQPQLPIPGLRDGL